MIRDEDLNAIKNGLKTYFRYNKEGPARIDLTPEMARKLLKLLENLDELRVDNIFNKHEIEMFSQADILTYAKNSMAVKIADKLVEDGYVDFLLTEDYSDSFIQRLRASVIVLKTEKDNEKSIPWDGGYVRMNEEVIDGIRKDK